MAPPHESHLPALTDFRRAEAGGDLQATLVELIELSLLSKQPHWNIVGRPFKPLHEHLDELVVSWRELSDTVAEHAVALGVPPRRPGGSRDRRQWLRPRRRWRPRHRRCSG